ncbi:hypothetical protein EJ05DRAFT_473123 [Pseudovirgaria hyperparasitica]|uniref:MARVEL domain-containing protein n=1 Tax=Pseudovirgaria hyperparasitica TaxID=470096 RepID=A0A6A6WJ40_9PEZI|nr:uncharacterized protein EJ05DRAFT_473123 [Pseudovirgaria hyperparasitica]KAF2762205.1 hypothetical protein EJ05DRAFT_473123 [Pseudovirgaria hyperparasitica]
MVISRILSFALRVLQFISSVIVMGIVAYEVSLYNDNGYSRLPDSWEWIYYVLAVSALGTLASLVLLIPFKATFSLWVVDGILSILWFAAFGVSAHYFEPINDSDRGCDLRRLRSVCGRAKAWQAFSFLAAIFFLISLFLGIWVHRSGRKSQSSV